jgi:hypothetical protein
VIRSFSLLLALAASCAPAPVHPIDRISAEKIRADIAYVACDDMGGRDTPSAGQRLTARFIRNRLERLGWKPGARDGWFHTFDLFNRTLDESGCSAVARRGDRELSFAFSTDYSIAPQQVMDLDLAADVVHLGPVPEKMEPAAAAAAKGKWAFFSEPGGSLQAAEEILLRAGAAGVLTTLHVMTNLGGDPEGGLVFKHFANVMNAGRISWPEKETLPRVYLKKRMIDALFEFSGMERARIGPMPIRFTEKRRLRSNQVVPCENVLAYWPGRSRDTIIVSAHYDHVGIDRRGQVLNGADDNATGTCALLALAEAISAHGPLDKSVLLAWVSAEELGLWGSRAFVENPWFPGGGPPVANINLDMIGRNAGNELLIAPFDSGHPKRNALADRAKSIAVEEGFPGISSGDGYFERSDHAMFAKLGIPVVFLTDGMHPDYHQPGDDPEKVDADKVRRVARIVFRLLVD